MGDRSDKMLQIDTTKIVLERANQGLTMNELALKAGISRKTLYMVENNIGNVRGTTFGKVAKGLGKPLEYFMKKD